MEFLRKRILISLVIFLIALNLDFILPRLVPGNAAEIFASGRLLPAAAVKTIEERLGLGAPLIVQYFLFLKGIFATWPPFFGYSYEFYPLTVSEMIAYRLPWTLLLVGVSAVLAVTLAYFAAGLTILRRQGKTEFSVLSSGIFFRSIPAFWLGMVLLWIFGVYLGWLPIFGTTSFHSGGGLQYFLDVSAHALLPVLTLTAVLYSFYYFVLRGSMQSILGADFIIAARARGLSENVIAFRYILRNSLLPLVSLLGFSIASLVSSVVVVESVFSYNGIGDLIVDAVLNRDYPILEGCFFYITVLVILLGLLGDYLLLRLDPRLRR